MPDNFHLRFQQILNDSGYKKSQAAEEMGVSPAYISQLCAGSRSPSDRTIADICRIFDVQEDWLRYGLEPMRAAVSREDEIAELVGKALNGSNDLKKAVIRMICSRTEQELAVLDKALRDLYEEMKKD